MLRGDSIKPAQGKLGVLIVGLGAVSTTFVAGVEAIKKVKQKLLVLYRRWLQLDWENVLIIVVP